MKPTLNLKYSGTYSYGNNNNNNNSLYFERVTHLANYRLIFHEALYYLHYTQQPGKKKKNHIKTTSENA